MATRKNEQRFIAMAQKAHRTKDSMDLRYALRFGVDNNIPNKTIRKNFG